MYKIYIDNIQNELMEKLAKKVTDDLLPFDNCIVYSKNKEQTRQDVQNLELNAYIKLQDMAKSPGHEVILEEMSKVSNGLGKEVYNSVKQIHYLTEKDKGLIYVSGVLEKEFIEIPSIILNIIDKRDKEEVEWLTNNIELVSDAIAKGIIKSFALKKC